MTDPLSTLLHDTAARVPTALHAGAELRDNARRHQRVRRAGTAATLAAALVITVIGITAPGGDRKAAPPPAQERPPLDSTSLLIADELPAWGSFSWPSVEVAEGETALPPELCHPGSIRDLGAEDVWHASFATTDSLEVRQVAARFPTDEQAAAAFGALTGRFRDCKGFSPEDSRLPPLTTATGGQALTGGFIRDLPDDPDNALFAVVSYGVTGDAVTVIWYTLVGQDDSFGANPLATTMTFALHRLEGSRTISENAIPADFRFAEERTSPSWQSSQDVDRNRGLAAVWASNPCQYDNGNPGLAPPASDALRTGAVTAAMVAPDGGQPVRQLVLYPDQQTAEAAAAELRSAYARCASITSFMSTTTWTLAPEKGRGDLTVFWSEEVDDSDVDFPPRAPVVAIQVRGNAVFLASESHDEEPRADSTAVQSIRAAVEANLPLVCEVADCP